MAEGRFASLPRSLHTHPGVTSPSSLCVSGGGTCSSRRLQASLVTSMDLLGSRPGWVEGAASLKANNKHHTSNSHLYLWLSASLPDRTAACRRPLLQPASPSPYTEPCRGVRKGPGTLTGTTPGTPEPIRRHVSINLRRRRCSKTAAKSFTLTGKRKGAR